MKCEWPSTFFWLFTALLLAPDLCISMDSLSVSQSVRDGDTIISAAGMFQLGFFNTNSSGNRYLGIWYNKIQPRTIVWVANRDKPVNDSSGTLMIQDDGNLVILDGIGRLIWSSNIIHNTSSNGMVARLLDSGNLVLLKDDGSSNNKETYLWQSFDHPTDTILPGMKIGWDLRINLSIHLTSWKSPENPSSGDFTWGVDPHGVPHLLLQEGDTKKFQTGPMDELETSKHAAQNQFMPRVVNTPPDIYYSYDQDNGTTITRAVLNYSGVYQRYVWDNGKLQWIVVHTIPSDLCDEYRSCGPNSICTFSNFQLCTCLMDYEPKVPQEWNMLIWSSGCVKKSPVSCTSREAFKNLERMKWPDLLQIKVNSSLNLEECKAECLKNCSCTAFANGQGSGCILWFGDLVDMRIVDMYDSSDIFIRVTATHLGKSHKKKLELVVALSVSVAFVILICSWVFWKKRTRFREARVDIQVKHENNLELDMFDMITVSKATDNFSSWNKIGEGGFGPVYKGQLQTGQEIAVKRLSEDSRQGFDEFKNEVTFIAKLQHRNLVRLLGCCIEGQERMLIYEYMPNGSLDSLIFSKTIPNALKWPSRFNIIIGVARGLLYLHRDSRLTIIHRDLKASNVLLDNEMNPKISDFGLARIFGGDLSLAKTKRIIGTYGYMPPEYVIDGIISVKSDVFSFGVLVLEVVSGKRNREFQHLDHTFNLLGHAWKLWEEDEALKLVDERMGGSLAAPEVMRCIQVGLLCVQNHPEDRPTMSSVLMMFYSQNVPLPRPKQPGFYTERTVKKTNYKIDGGSHNSNHITVTQLQGR